MRVHVKLTEEDYVEGVRFYFRKTLGGIQMMRRNSRVLWVIIIMVPLLLGWVFFLAGQEQDAVFVSVVTLICLAALYPFMRHRMRKQAEKNSLTILRSDPNALELFENVIEITPESLSWESELVSSRVSWKVIENIYETPKYLFILLGSASGTTTIPLRCFDTPEDAAAFATAARRYLDEAHSARNSE